MRIAIDASSLVINRFNGLSEVIHNLLLYLPFAGPTNHFSLYVNTFRTPGSIDEICYPDTVNHIFRVPRRLVDIWWHNGWPPFELYLKEIDVFHSLHINVPPTKKIKTILTVHDCRYLAYPDLYDDHEVAKYRRQMEASLRRVDLICTVSEFTRQEVLAYFTFPDDRIKVIHNGFTPIEGNNGKYKKKADKYIKENNLPKSYLFFVGALDPRKNLNRLLGAMARCKLEANDFPDMLLGGVSLKQWVKSKYASRAKELGLFENIHPCGVLEKDILIGLTQQACALCYPSLYEGFGFPPLEAMSLGVPVLAGRRSSIPEIVGDSACLVDPESVDDIANGLNKIVFDSDYRQLLIESGYHQITKFSWKKAAAEYMNLYKEVLAS